MNQLVKSTRSSNLELYRIICMLMIVAHHYVVNSGLTSADGPLRMDPNSVNSIFLWLFGAWGKVGINCFLMITGYFMCTNQITLKKFLKLLLQIYLYKLILFPIFLIAGYETLTFQRLVTLIMPCWGLQDDFVGCFLVFYLTIPFWNILIRNMTQRQHQLLMALLLLGYTLFGSIPIPLFRISFNYVTWFGIVYVVASYVRLYPNRLFERRSLWGGLTLVSMALSMLSIFVINICSPILKAQYFFLADSNKLMAVAIAFCSFLWFKNMDIKYNKIINAFGAATFGVLLIHANSNAMRTWLWKNIVDSVGHYDMPLGSLILYSLGVVLAVFLVCNLIDQLRIATLEKWFFNWYDRKIAAKANAFVNKMVKKQ